MVTWEQHVRVLESQIGYPITDGETSWVVMMDLRGEKLLDTVRYYACGRDEVEGSWEGKDGSGVEFTKIKAGEICYYDEKEKWYDLTGVRIYRDGTIKFLGEWNKQSVCLVNEIDEWLHVFYRTAPYQRPQLKISLINHKVGWQTTLRRLGLQENYNMMGYKFLFKGRALNVDVTTVPKYRILKQWTEGFRLALNLYFQPQKLLNKGEREKVRQHIVDTVAVATPSTPASTENVVEDRLKRLQSMVSRGK